MSSKISDLFKAIASRDVDELRNLLNSDRSLTNKENEQGLIPLGFAAHFGNRDCVQILLHFNVKIDATSHSKVEYIPSNTALHAAIAGARNIEVIELLLQNNH